MRGEDNADIYHYSSLKGSPPHARGRLKLEVTKDPITRITPACAGKTSWSRPGTSTARDHPRLRGEDRRRRKVACMIHGSPPPARGRRGFGEWRRRRGRITPACAGKTPSLFRDTIRGMDHPRMRGEDRRLVPINTTKRGSPPHARGRRHSGDGGESTAWITPACAGKTFK